MATAICFVVGMKLDVNSSDGQVCDERPSQRATFVLVCMGSAFRLNDVLVAGLRQTTVRLGIRVQCVISSGQAPCQELQAWTLNASVLAF